MSKYLITGLDLSKNNAGPKARTDINYFLRQVGFRDLCKFDFKQAFIHWRKHEYMWHQIPQALENLKGQDSTVVFQYPIYSKLLMQRILRAAKENVRRFYVIVHDLESLRIFKKRPGFQQFEVNFFNQTSGLIVHNDHMKQALREMGVKVPMVSLEIFDYYDDASLMTTRLFNRQVAFAGNLAKANFLERWNLKQSIHLYGPHKHLHYPENVKYCGLYSPEELPNHLQESFGLIWDGNRLDECNGMYGDYLKYNNPHKTSLYLSSGMPVIVWNQSAMADFVKQQHVGIAIADLHDLDQLLPTMSAADYAEMQHNAVKLAKKLRTGWYIKRGIEKLMQLN